MFSVTRICQNSPIFSQVRASVGFSPRNFVRINPVKRYSTLVCRPQPPKNNLKISNFLRGSGTTTASAVRSNSNTSNKGRKAVGYWLLTCGGMVFVAVVLGTVIAYYVVLVSIYAVLSEVIKKTVG